VLKTQICVTSPQCVNILILHINWKSYNFFSYFSCELFGICLWLHSHLPYLQLFENRHTWASIFFLFIAMLNLLFNNLSVPAISYFCRWFWHSTSLHCLKETEKHCSLFDSAFEVLRRQLVLCAHCWLLPPLLIIIKISVYFIVFEFSVVGLHLIKDPI